MSDEHLLRRIMMLGNEIGELKQDVILHRDLATKMHEHNIQLRGLLRRALVMFRDEVDPIADFDEWLTHIDRISESKFAEELKDAQTING